MRSSWGNLFHSGLIAASVMLAATPSRASFVFSEGESSHYTFLGQKLTTRTELRQAGPAWDTSVSSTSLTLLIDAPSDSESDIHRNDSYPHPPFSKLRSGMLPSSASFSQMVGSGMGGPAIENQPKKSPLDAFQATLLTESRTVLPTGPTFRWFRPPRA